MSIQAAIGTAESMTDLARRLGVTYQAIQKWIAQGVPLDRCVAVELATGVRCEDLRPDVQWNRNSDGAVTGYTVPLPEAASRAA